MAQRKPGRPAPGQQSSTAMPIPGWKTKVFRVSEEDIALQRMEGPFESFDGGATHIDGSYFEGGGQVVRNAVALASITGQKLRISDVRANRRPSGLAYQHCTGVELVTRICDGVVGGAAVGSTEVRLAPGTIVPGRYVADPGTAGATALLAQAALPCLLLAGPLQNGGEEMEALGKGGGASAAAKERSGTESGFEQEGKAGEHVTASVSLVDYADDTEQEEAGPSHKEGMGAGKEGSAVTGGGFSSLLLRGGTDASKAPPIDYIKEVLFPTVKRLLGVELEMHVKRRGFYPKGNGELTVTITKSVERGKCLPAFSLTERGNVTSVHVRAFTAGALPQHVSEEMLQSARAVLDSFFSSPAFASPPPVQYESVRETPESAFGNGAGILLLAETSTGCRLAGSRVLERGQKGADAGREAAEDLVGDLRSGGCVDRYLQDQLVVFMAAAEGTSRLLIGRPTLHTCTAVWVAESMASARFRLLTHDGQPATNLLREPTGGHNEFGDPGTESWILECDGAALNV